MIRRTLMLIEDDRVFRERLTKSFVDRELEVLAVESISQLKATVLPLHLDYAVIDLRIGSESGLDALSYLLQERPDCRALMLTGFGTIATSVEAIKLGAINYLTKPTNAQAILLTLEEGEALDPARGDYFDHQLPPTLAQAEWEHIQRVLKSCDGNVTQAAALLGLHRRSLQRKLGKDPSGLR